VENLEDRALGLGRHDNAGLDAREHLCDGESGLDAADLGGGLALLLWEEIHKVRACTWMNGTELI
jgi:hypothetical protein